MVLLFVVLAAGIAILLLLRYKHGFDACDKAIPFQDRVDNLINLLLEKNDDCLNAALIKRDFLLASGYKELLHSVRYVDKTLKKLMGDILSHMNLKPVNIEIFVDYSDCYSDCNSSNYSFNPFKYEETGNYESNTQQRSIEIRLKKGYTYKELSAILVHECSHYFAEVYHITAENKVINEQNTDILAIILGFGAILEEGYQEHEEVCHGTIKKTKIGYIASANCSQIKEYVHAKKEVLRAQWEDKKREEKEIALECENMLKKLDLAIQYYEDFRQLANMFRNQKHGVEGQVLQEVLQEIYLEVESPTIPSKFVSLKNRLSKIDKIEKNKEAIIQKKLMKYFVKYLIGEQICYRV
jgi:hypothetical protein